MSRLFGKRKEPTPPATASLFGLELRDAEFRDISRLVFERAGICLGDHKKDLVRTRLQKRLRALSMGSYGDYYRYVTSEPDGAEELIHLLDAISTNKTDFFRENQHFEFLQAEALPKLLLTREKEQRRLRFWSAGCSSGEEPYTLAMVLSKAIPNLRAWDLRILATDISTRALQRATEGRYNADQIAGVPAMMRSEFLTSIGAGPDKTYLIKPELKDFIAFRRLNLMDDQFPFQGRFDVIFCRNVMIYFDKPTQERLVNKFHHYLAPGGYLFIGHSESLAGIQTPFRYLRPTIYRK